MLFRIRHEQVYSWVTIVSSYGVNYTMIFSIDVECVAVGNDHNARSVAQISLVVRLVAMQILSGDVWIWLSTLAFIFPDFYCYDGI